MLNVLIFGVGAAGLAAGLAGILGVGPHVLESFRYRRRMHHRLEAVRRLRP